MGSLIEYFKKETAKSVLEKAIDHAIKVQESVEKLDKGVKILIQKKDIDKAHNILHQVDLLEGDADTIRRDILSLISKGELNPSVRTDLSHLIKRLDDVANCSTGVARRINTIPIMFWEQSSSKSIDLIIQMMDKTVECSKYLDKIVSDLLGKRQNIREFAEKINKLEHEVDILNIELRRSLQETPYDVNSFSIFVVGNTIDIIEAISDAIEAVADYIMLLLSSTSV